MNIAFRPEDPAFVSDPFPLYRNMQDEDPCHWSPSLKSWVLTRYADIKDVCLDREMSSDRLRPFFASMAAGDAARIPSIIRYLSEWMVFKDPPDHTRLRRLAGKVFNVQSMHAMRPAVETIVSWLFERIGEREEIDFVADFAGPLPCLVIMAMLGVPREDLARVKRMSDDMALFIGSSRTSAEKYDTAEAATREMADYYRDMIADRRANPRDDALSRLVHLRDGDDAFTDDELTATLILMLFAGHETTTNHLANGMLALTAFPGEAARLRADPSLAADAVEELLRYDGPSGAQVRIAGAPRTLHGKSIAPGERIFIMLNAANRDPRAYPDPDRVDLGRDGVPHLSFGFGTHICLGFPLARLEGQVALPAVVARWSHIERASDRVEWINSLVFRGMKALPLRVRQ